MNEPFVSCKMIMNYINSWLFCQKGNLFMIQTKLLLLMLPPVDAKFELYFSDMLHVHLFKF